MTGSQIEDRRPLVVHEPYVGALPPLRPYLGQLWRRRAFAYRVAMSDLRARHYDTVLGLVWLVLNPIFLAAIYFVLMTVIIEGQSRRVEYVAVLLGGLFAFYYTRNALSLGAGSIVSGANLVANTAFPRALLPVASIVSAFLTYLPMLAVYAGFHLAVGLPVGLQTLWLLPLLVLHTMFNAGAALALAAGAVLLRDVNAVLPYLLRVWLYLSPVLYTVEQVPDTLEPFFLLNPLYSLLGTWQAAVVQGNAPEATMLLIAAGWSAGAVLCGGYFFMRREREFALRL